MPKTIADLVTTESAKPQVIGKSMLSDPKQTIDKLKLKVQQLEEQRRKEEAMLELGGYDYDGQEEFARVMAHLGRR